MTRVPGKKHAFSWDQTRQVLRVILKMPAGFARAFKMGFPESVGRTMENPKHLNISLLIITFSVKMSILPAPFSDPNEPNVHILLVSFSPVKL